MDNKHNWDSLYTDLNIACLDNPNDYGLIQNGAIGINNGKISWIGPMADLPSYQSTKTYSHPNIFITPGLIDPHTHLIYGGSRVNEFSRKLSGESYESIIQSGGGIHRTVQSTRDLNQQDLYRLAEKRLRQMINHGVTSVEIKSGYGLDKMTEINLLKTADLLQQDNPVNIKKTYLGAHAIPKNHTPEQYINLICNTIIPEIKNNNLADFIDIFCESIGFDLEQTEKVFKTAQEYNLKIKSHAEQLSNMGAAKLAAKYNAISCEHLEYIDQSGVEALKKSNTIAVLLPGAYYFLQQTQKPPIELFRKYNIPMAIGTDCNPGSCPSTNILLMLNMACVLFNLTPLESLMGITRNAAKAIDLFDSVGSLEVGKQADFVAWDIGHPDELSYAMGNNPRVFTVFKGEKAA